MRCRRPFPNASTRRVVIVGMNTIFTIHLIDDAGRVWIHDATATNPDDALTELQRMGEYVPPRHRVLLIARTTQQTK